MSDDCLFCKIVAGAIPSDEVASTDSTYAFRDIDPQAPVHVLVIPKRHVKDAASAEAPSVVADLLATAQTVAATEELSNGYRLVFNVGDDANNAVPHLHLHVIGGRKMAWPPG